jgi:hypothetical protein
MKKLLLVSVLALLLSTLCQSVYACSCPTIGGFTREQEIQALVKRSDTAVFTGEVIEIINRAGYREIKFQIEQYWAGKVTNEFTIRTDKLNSSCAFYFQVGKDYLVFAETFKGSLYTGACSRNSERKEGLEDLKILGKGKEPAKTQASAEVYACSCPKFGPPGEVLTREQQIKRMVQRSDTVVFSGEVISIKDIADQKYFRDITFKAGRYWNGTVTSELTIRSFQPFSSCAFDFKIGASYLMFAILYQNGLYADECYGIQELKNAVEDLKHLGQGKIPAEKEPKDN